MQARARGDHDRPVLVVEHIQARLGVLDVHLEAHQRHDGDSPALRKRVAAPPVFILHPRVNDARLAVADARSRLALRCYLAAEIDLEVAIGYLGRIAQVDGRAALE